MYGAVAVESVALGLNRDVLERGIWWRRELRELLMSRLLAWIHAFWI